MRVGIGYDVHRLVDDRPLILGGVGIPFEKGLKGHSDADVLIHAIMDALLGAAGLGDIGHNFPDTDAAYEGISSLLLLRKVGELLHKEGFEIGNIDAVIVAQRPKVMPFRDQMSQNMAKVLNIPVSSVHIKATTTEGLGFEGHGEGIAAHAIALIKVVGHA